MLRIPHGRSLFFLVTIATGALLRSSVGAQPTNSAVQTHFFAAQQDQQQGRLDAAVQEYQAVLRLQPGIPEVYANLGLVYYAQAKFAPSAQALGTAAKLRPGMRGVSLWLGIDEVKLDRPAQGATLLREAIRQNPNDKIAQSWLGTALWNAGQMDASLLQLRAAAARFPDDPDLLFALAEAYGKAVHQQTDDLLEQTSSTALSDRIYADTYVQERDWKKAEGHLRRALERDPRSVDARLELADVFFRQSQFSDAQEQLDQALTLAPASAAALARTGELLILTQKPAEGLARIEKALDLDRSEALDAFGLPVANPLEAENFDAAGQLASLCRQAAEKLAAEPASPAKQAALAALYAQAGDQDAAMRAYQSIGHTDAESARAANLFAEATTSLHQHRYDEAESELLRWIALHPGDRESRYDLILVRRHIAMAQVFRLVAVAPDSYQVHQLLGQLYMDRGEDNKAISEYLAVAAARPDLPGVHFWLGHLYWKHADADHALVELTRELQLDPTNPEANGELGSVLVAEGRAAEAIPHLELAVRRKPDLWPAYAQLGSAYASEKNYTGAEEALKRALAHDPDGSAHYQLARVLRAEGKAAQANQMFAEVRAIKNESMTATPAGAEQGATP